MPLLTIEQASDLLKVKRSWLRCQVFKKAIPYVKVGRHVRFELTEIERWIAENAIPVGGGQ